MMDYHAALIGTGRPPNEPHPEGHVAVGYRHGETYRSVEKATLTACADIKEENAIAFARNFDIPESQAYDDHIEMLSQEKPDIVNIATPTSTHAELVIDCARAGVRAIHCEKPMAASWGEALLMAQECRRRNVQLTFNHQLRFSEQARQAKELLDDGVIGTLTRMEIARTDIYENGTHHIDLCGYFNDDRPAEWVLAGIDYQLRNVKRDVHNENNTVALWEYENGVATLAVMGDHAGMIGCNNRLIGTDGVIELNLSAPTLRVKQEGSDWEQLDGTTSGAMASGFGHILETLENDEESLLSARRALNTTEIIFSVYESVSQRGRIDLPLTTWENALEEMVDKGLLTPS